MPSSLITTLRSNLPADLYCCVELGEADQHNLLHALAAVPDPRDRRGVRYRLASLLAVAGCAVLAGRGRRLPVAGLGAARGARLSVCPLWSPAQSRRPPP